MSEGRLTFIIQFVSNAHEVVEMFFFFFKSDHEGSSPH